MKRAVVLLIMASALAPLSSRPAPWDEARAGAAQPWRSLEPGLDFGEFEAPRPPDDGDARIRVLRIDPARFALKLFNASAPGEGKPFTAREWCRRKDLVAAINASMYQQDYLTSVSLMKTRGYANNTRLSKDKAVLAFDARGPDVPAVSLIDRECDNFDSLSKRYGSLVQSIRMVGCGRRNVWSPQPRRWSTAAVGLDASGRVLFIHVRSPYATHDLIDILLGLPIDLARAMYVEGGPESQLYVRAGGSEREFVGSFESGFVEDDANTEAWPVPNVIAVARRGAND